MKIAYIADEPKIDAVNLQFLETAKLLKNEIEFIFFFLSDKSCKDNNIIKQIQDIGCEYHIHDVDCGCKSKYNEASNYFDNKLKELEINIVQIGFMVKYLDCFKNKSRKNYGIFFKKGQDHIFEKVPDNLEIINTLDKIIITFDVLDYYDDLKSKMNNEIILSNTLNTSDFLNLSQSQVKIDSHMNAYRNFYLN